MATAAMMTNLVKALGRSYEELLAAGLLASAESWKLFEQDDQFHVNVEPGLVLTFDEGNRQLSSIAIALLEVVQGNPIYRGELPKPFKPQMTKSDVHSLLGEPDESQGPQKMPKPIGQTGGWDAYRLDEAAHRNDLVECQYTAGKEVDSLFCSLAGKA